MSKIYLAGIIVLVGFVGVLQLPNVVQHVDAQSEESAAGPAPTTSWWEKSIPTAVTEAWSQVGTTM